MKNNLVVNLETGKIGEGTSFSNPFSLAKTATMDELVLIGKELGVTINKSKSKPNAAERIFLKVKGISGKKEIKKEKTPKVREKNLALVIKLLVTENPKNENSASGKRFALYKNSMTVAEFLKAGGLMADIYWDRSHKFIETA